MKSATDISATFPPVSIPSITAPSGVIAKWSFVVIPLMLRPLLRTPLLIHHRGDEF